MMRCVQFFLRIHFSVRLFHIFFSMCAYKSNDNNINRCIDLYIASSIVHLHNSKPKFKFKPMEGKPLGVFLSEVLRLPTLAHVLQLVEWSVLSRSILSPLKPLSQLDDGPGGLWRISLGLELFFSFQPPSFEFIDDWKVIFIKN